MSKKKKEKVELNHEVLKDNEILGASLKDQFCIHKYKNLRGVSPGFIHNVKGVGIVKDTMIEAFQRLNVHMAVIDGIFKHSGIEIDNIDDFHNHELTSLFDVTGFEIKGGEENEGIILKGTKYLAPFGAADFNTPQIMIDNLSGYTWFNELKTEADNVRNEVDLYIKGNFTLPEKEEEEDPNQLTIADQLEEVEE